MRIEDFDYDLPPAAIAQTPVEPRDSARLLDASSGVIADRTVADLPSLLGPGDVVVVNRTRVMPARLRLHKATGAAVEVFLLEHRGDGSWEALVRPGRKVPPGTRLDAGTDLVVEVGERRPDGSRIVRIESDDPDAAIAAHGQVPLPPYISGEGVDPERYQTIYATTPGSVAAPTAGLHLTDAVFAGLAARGVPVVPVDLLVGIGTFKPITVDDITEHRMHEERFHVPDATIEVIASARRVVAVGTTTIRALESAARLGRTDGRTDLYLTPGSDFRVVDVLLTNFHMPRSSLLVLLEAFAGPDWRAWYRHALAGGYRFLSFGDAMLVHRRPGVDGPRWPAP